MSNTANSENKSANASGEVENGESSPPWQRKQGEPTFWYARFQTYLFMGSDRTLLGAVNLDRAKKSKQKGSKIPGSWVKAYYDWQWKLRAESWDDEQLKQREREWQQRREEIRQLEWAIAKKLIAKAEQMLETDIGCAKWTLNTPGYLSEVGSRLARQSAELTQVDLNSALNIVRRYSYEIKDPALMPGEEEF